MKTKTPGASPRTRRTAEQRIADLQKRIEQIKARAAERKIKTSPALKHIRAAVRAIGKAASQTDDVATRKALEEARSLLSACLSLNGVRNNGRDGAERKGGRRTFDQAAGIADDLLQYVIRNPGRRGEQIAAALGTDTHAMRTPMKKLIEAEKIRTTGQRRGMAYFPA